MTVSTYCTAILSQIVFIPFVRKIKLKKLQSYIIYLIFSRHFFLHLMCNLCKKKKKSSEPQWLKSRAFFPRKEVAIDAFPILQSTMAIADKIVKMSCADTVNSHLLFLCLHLNSALKIKKVRLQSLWFARLFFVKIAHKMQKKCLLKIRYTI